MKHPVEYYQERDRMCSIPTHQWKFEEWKHVYMNFPDYDCYSRETDECCLSWYDWMIKHSYWYARMDSERLKPAIASVAAV